MKNSCKINDYVKTVPVDYSGEGFYPDKGDMA